MAEVNKERVQELLNDYSYDSIVARHDYIKDLYLDVLYNDLCNEQRRKMLLRVYGNEISALICAQHMKMPNTEITRYEIAGKFMPIGDFIYGCETEMFNDRDGFACYAESDGTGTSCNIKPNWVKQGFIRTDFDYVIWVDVKLAKV